MLYVGSLQLKSEQWVVSHCDNTRQLQTMFIHTTLGWGAARSVCGRSDRPEYPR